MEQQLDNEISLKELIEKLVSTWKYLLSKWVLIGMLGVMGAGIGFFIAWSKPIKYTARISFVAEEGKSSVGRLGIDIHATAGKGDVGFWLDGQVHRWKNGELFSFDISKNHYGFNNTDQERALLVLDFDSDEWGEALKPYMRLENETI